MFIKADNFLFTTVVEYIDVSFHDFADMHGMFLTDSESDIPFDPFAASFYLVSRFEEYVEVNRDEHDRFEAGQSTASKYRFLQEPVVDQWAYKIKELILTKYPKSVFPEKSFKVISTIDIDNAFAYLNKGLGRTVFGLIKSIVTVNYKDLYLRLATLFGAIPDPYDTYGYIAGIHEKYNLKPIYFFLFGRYGKYDKNISPANEIFQKLIRSISMYTDVGIHPSYTSNFDFIQLKTEIKKLAVVAGKWILHSRQHFLKLSLPNTYYNLTKAGITHDYTMGYASDNGFRAGTCTPFKFYDLKHEHILDITIVPFQVMDSSFRFYLGLKPDEALEKIKKIIDAVKKVNGTFVPLWHNESLGDELEWKGWRKVYEKMFEYLFPE